MRKSFCPLSWVRVIRPCSSHTLLLQRSSGLMSNSVYNFSQYLSDLLLSLPFSCWFEDAMDGSLLRDFENGPKAPVLECSVTADNRRWPFLHFTLIRKSESEEAGRCPAHPGEFGKTIRAFNFHGNLSHIKNRDCHGNMQYDKAKVHFYYFTKYTRRHFRMKWAV